MLFFVLHFSTGKIDCKAYYDKILSPLSIKGELVKKEETDHYFVLYIKNEKDDKDIELKLLKNNTGKKIFKFVDSKCIIVKRENQTVIRVAKPTNGGFDVQLFPDLCE